VATAEFCRCLFKFTVVAAVQDESRTVGRQPMGEFSAEAVCGAGDEDGAGVVHG
jgi:hypothetical protein